jgi:RNA polymerase sigma-70 factor (ECF subfamily)
MKYLKNEDEAEDAAMEIFESLSEKLIKHDVKYFKSWIYTLTKNHCLMKLRKKKTIVSSEIILNNHEFSVENDSILHLDNEDQKNKDLLVKCLNELKPEQKICVELMYLQGKSYKEITVETGFDLKRVKSFIQNGKRNLRLMMEQNNENKQRK